MTPALKARFITSSSDPKTCPSPTIPEYAFIGRSNVGKSSLINRLTGNGKLAKTSSTPGKTQLINHFQIEDKWFLVDLPGYGYAKVSKTSREKWNQTTEEYLSTRENLMCTMVLLDGRHEPQKIDLEFMQRMGEKGLPFVMVFTKIDKMTRTALAKTQANYKRKMLEIWEELPQFFLTSAQSGAGRDELLQFITETNALWKKP